MAQIVFKEKDYEFTNKNRLLKLVQTSDNPLKTDRPRVQVQRGRTKNVQVKTTGNFVDPLSRQAKSTEPVKAVDPLSRDPLSRDPLKRQQSAKPQQLEQSQPAIEEPEKKVDVDGTTKISWELSSQWQEIRADYTEQFDLRNVNLDGTITNPFGNQVQSLNTFDGSARAAHSGESRMEYDRTAKQTVPGKQITQRTYVQKVEDIRRELRKNWLNGDKVASLQLAIQSCKLLIDNEKPLFAPIKYVFVIDILETFGRFVIERLLKLSYPNYSDQRIQETSLQSVVGSNISETAMEIGRNWLIKIGSIRELLPRLYIEATLLKVYYFIDPARIRAIFNRLIRSVRAIGDYINAMQFALYLFRLAAEIFSGEKDFIISTLKDFFVFMKQKKTFCKPGVPEEEYMNLFQPFLKQTFRLYSQNCSEREFRELFEHFRQSNQNHLVLKKMLEIFPAVNICSMALELFSIMQSYPVEVKYQLYALFLPKIAKGLTNKAAGMEICELVLVDCMHIKSFPLFLDILASLIELIFRSFTGFEKSQFFFKILQKFNDLFLLVERDSISNQTNKTVFVKLHSFIINIFQNAENLQEVLQIDTFVQCIQFFPQDMKPQVCKDLLRIIIERDPSERIEDPMAVHSILSLAKVLNERKNIQTKEEQLYLSTLINGFLKRVDFNRDLEQTLNLYADVRANFGNIGDISENLINRTIELTVKAKRFAKGKNSKKVVQFLQACIAYCYITIPTIENFISRLRLYVQVAQIGLSIQLLQQTEALFKSAIELINDAPQTIDGKDSDLVLYPYMVDLLSFLIVMPDDPELEYLSLFNGVYQVILNFKWNQKNGGVLQLNALLACMQYLCCQVQERLPYHMEGVKSNDQLFNKETDFKLKIVEVVQQVNLQIDELADRINKTVINDSLDNALVARITLAAIHRILNMVKVTPKNCSTVVKLVQLIVKKLQELNKDRIGKVQISLLKTYIISTIQHVERTVGIPLDSEKEQTMKIIELNK